MKRFLKPSDLPYIALCGGLLTCIARMLLFISALGSEDGLLPVGTWPDLLSWGLVAVAMGLLLVGIWPIQDTVRFSQKYSKTLFAAISMAVAAVGFGLTSLLELTSEMDMISFVSTLFGFLAAAALGLLAWGRMKGKQLNMVFHGIVCVYLMLHLVSHYRLWSSYPQLQSYAFELMAIVFVMLASYHRAAADAGHGAYRAYTFFSLAAVYFCIATLPGCDNPVFFLGCALWMFFTPSRLPSSSRREA